MRHIDYVQNSIDDICSSKADASILTLRQESISLSQYISAFSLSKSSIQMIYNQLSRREVRYLDTKDRVSYGHIGYIYSTNDVLRKSTIDILRSMDVPESNISTLNRLYDNKVKATTNDIVRILRGLSMDKGYLDSVNAFINTVPSLGNVQTYSTPSTPIPDGLNIIRFLIDTFPNNVSKTEANVQINMKVDPELHKVLSILKGYTTNSDTVSDIARVESGRIDLTIDSESSIPIHMLCSSGIHDRPNDLYRIYARLKGTVSMAKKSIPHDIVVGAIVYAQIHNSDDGYNASKTDTLSSTQREYIQTMVSHMRYFEAESSPIYITYKVLIDGYHTYIGRLGLKCSNQYFYKKALIAVHNYTPTRLAMDAMKEYISYEPKVESQRILIQPNAPIHLVDIISSATTSSDIPLIAINDGKQTIYKSYIKGRKRPEWVLDIEPYTMHIYVRISKYLDKYVHIEYDANVGSFSFMRENKYLPLDTIMDRLYTHLGLTTLSTPITSTYTYSFITNFVASRDEKQVECMGIDRNIMAWLLTNPPPEYATKIQRTIGAQHIYEGPCLDSYVFVIEGNKPDSMKQHINIHVQLGTDKMFMTISQMKTSSKLITKYIDADGYEQSTAFDNNQSYFCVSINKCPSIHHAYICREIYTHIISMYLQYYSQVHKYLIDRIVPASLVASGDFPTLGAPYLVPLRTATPTLRDIYTHIDPILYSHLPSNSTNLPVPIDRDEIIYWRSRGYTVMRLPTTVMNDPRIKFETSSEIWVRTVSPGTYFTLKAKDHGTVAVSNDNVESISRGYIDHGYIPMCTSDPYSSITINDDWTIYIPAPATKTGSYVKGATKSIEPDRAGNVHESTGMLIASLYGDSLMTPEMVSEIAKLRSTPSKKNLEDITIIETKYREMLRSSIVRIGTTVNIIDTLNKYIGDTHKGTKAADVANYAYLCLQECYDQSVSDIRDDILMGKVFLFKHFRALEHTYKINIYFMINDPIQPFMTNPPHAHFYLHRRGNRDWPSVIFIVSTTNMSTVDIIARTLSSTSTAKRDPLITNPVINPVSILDNMVDTNNVISAISPEQGIAMTINPNPSRLPITGGWDPFKQVVDKYGKGRAIVYRKLVIGGTYEYATVNMGFMGIVHNLPITYKVYNPSMRNNVVAIVADNPKLSTLPTSIMYTTGSSTFDTWSASERSARMLRSICHILYGTSKETIDTFADHIKVVKDHVGTYDTSLLPSSLLSLYTYKESISMSDYLWKYFSTYTAPNRPNPSRYAMIDYETKSIYVPSIQTKQAIYYYLKAAGKLRHPLNIPSYVKYSWDIRSTDEEHIHLDMIDIMNQIIVDGLPTSTRDIVVTTSPYIIQRNDTKYLVQMVRKSSDLRQVKYIAMMWDRSKINPGYGCVYPNELEYYSTVIPSVQHDFIDNEYSISYTTYQGRVFILLRI